MAVVDSGGRAPDGENWDFAAARARALSAGLAAHDKNATGGRLLFPTHNHTRERLINGTKALYLLAVIFAF